MLAVSQVALSSTCVKTRPKEHSPLSLAQTVASVPRFYIPVSELQPWAETHTRRRAVTHAYTLPAPRLHMLYRRWVPCNAPRSAKPPQRRCDPGAHTTTAQHAHGHVAAHGPFTAAATPLLHSQASARPYIPLHPPGSPAGGKCCRAYVAASRIATRGVPHNCVASGASQRSTCAQAHHRGSHYARRRGTSRSRHGGLQQASHLLVL